MTEYEVMLGHLTELSAIPELPVHEEEETILCMFCRCDKPVEHAHCSNCGNNYACNECYLEKMNRYTERIDKEFKCPICRSVLFNWFENESDDSSSDEEEEVILSKESWICQAKKNTCNCPNCRETKEYKSAPICGMTNPSDEKECIDCGKLYNNSYWDCSKCNNRLELSVLSCIHCDGSWHCKYHKNLSAVMSSDEKYCLYCQYPATARPVECSTCQYKYYGNYSRCPLCYTPR